jgi:hypothetical protein
MTTGVRTANQVCCTEEFDFECLCCLDFSVPLQKCAPGSSGFCLSRCGVMDLDAANQPPGSPLAMEDDAQIPIPAMNYSASAAAQIVTVCTKDSAVGAVAAAGGGAAQLPLECIPREFTPGEIQGTQPDLATGVPLTPGQVILDERIAYLQKQGVPVPTCTNEFANKGGTCPHGTPKAGSPPNSAGDAALQNVYGMASTGGEEVEALAKSAFLHQKTEQKVVRRTRGRTFRDLADLTKDEVETVLGDSKAIGFAVGNKIVRFAVEQVSKEGGLTLVGQGKKLVVSEKSIELTDGTTTSEVDPSTTVVSLAGHRRVGRRAGGGSASTGSFTLMGGGNTAGND